MNKIWQFYPSSLGLYIRLADETAAHLDRAGVSFHISQPAEALARRIIEAEGREFVPETRGECMELAAKWGLFDTDAKGNYRWQEPLTRADAAVLAVRLMNKMGRG